MKVSTILRRACALVKRGWTKGAYKRRRGGKTLYCASGALGAAGRSWGEKAETGIAYVFLQRAIGRWPVVSAWNDAPRRRKSEVIAAFKRAEKAALAAGD